MVAFTWVELELLTVWPFSPLRAYLYYLCELQQEEVVGMECSSLSHSVESIKTSHRRFIIIPGLQASSVSVSYLVCKQVVFQYYTWFESKQASGVSVLYPVCKQASK